MSGFGGLAGSETTTWGQTVWRSDPATKLVLHRLGQRRNQHFLFVCLFVGIKPEKLYSFSCGEGSKPPGSGHTEAEAQIRDVHTKDRGTTVRAHVLVNKWLTPYKFTGWLASLDLRESIRYASTI